MQKREVTKKSGIISSVSSFSFRHLFVTPLLFLLLIYLAQSAVQSFSPFLQFRPRKSNVDLCAEIDSHPRRRLLIQSSSFLPLLIMGPSHANPTDELLQFPLFNISREGEIVNVTNHVTERNLTNVTLSPIGATPGTNTSFVAEIYRKNNTYLDDSNTSTIVTIRIPRADSNDTAILCEDETRINCTVIRQMLTF